MENNRNSLNSCRFIDMQLIEFAKETEKNQEIEILGHVIWSFNAYLVRMYRIQAFAHYMI